MLHIHDTIDLIEKEIKDSLGIDISIHMDPVLVGDKITDELKKKTGEILNGISNQLTFHDFRIVTGPTHTNLIFDLVIPYELKLTEKEIKERLDSALNSGETRYFTVITFDRSYT